MKINELDLDFETFSEADLGKVGSIHYAEHDSTEVLLVGYSVNKERPKVWFVPWDPMPADLKEALKSDCPIFSHNAAKFEKQISDNVAERQLGNQGWPRIRRDRWYDTQVLAAGLGLPWGLGALASCLKLAEKESEGKDLIKQFSILQTNKKTAIKKGAPPTYRIMPDDSPDDFIDFGAYCCQDIVCQQAVRNRLKNYWMSDEERELFQLDIDMNETGFLVDRFGVDKTIEVVDLYTEQIQQRCVELTGLRATQAQKLKAWLTERGIAIPNMQADTIDNWCKIVDIDPVVREVLLLVKSASRKALKKLYPMQYAVSEDNRAKACLAFYGTHTGRWSGKGIQPHNFMRPTIKNTEEITLPILLCAYSASYISGALELLYKDPLEAIGSCMRHFIIAGEDNLLYVADYASIEARVLCWLSGQKDALVSFENGVDVYKEMAAYVFKTTIEKVTGQQRQIGKALVLGCGYGMGWERFLTELETKWGIAGTTEKMAKKAVRAYREKYDTICDWKTGLWNRLERACISTVKDRSIQYVNNLKIYMKEDFLMIRLPSGREKAYPFAKVARKKRVKPNGNTVVEDKLYYYKNIKGNYFKMDSTYGGELVENITQAVARDILAFGMLEAKKKGYNMILTIHDELIAENHAEFNTVEHFENTVATTPKWSKGLPVTAEGYKAKRYRK